jgi:hypothetical protein
MVAIAGFGEEYPILIYVHAKTQREIEHDLDRYEPKAQYDVLGPQKDPRSELMHEVGTTSYYYDRPPH